MAKFSETIQQQDAENNHIVDYCNNFWAYIQWSGLRLCLNGKISNPCFQNLNHILVFHSYSRGIVSKCIFKEVLKDEHVMKTGTVM